MMQAGIDFSIEEFKDLSYKYDAFIIDLWGVIHDGVVAYPGSVECINSLIEFGKPIIFMSNAPRPNIMILKKLLELKIQATPDLIVTSGDITRISIAEELTKTPNKKYYHLGAQRNADLLANLNLCLTENIEQCETIVLTGYIDEGEDLSQFDLILTQAINLQIPIICANPDQIAVNGNKIRYCAGFLADKYEKLGGKVEYYGKPYLSIYNIALQNLKLKGVYDKNKILMIGDTLETDILGALNAKIRSALVLTGNTKNLLNKSKYNRLSTVGALQNLFLEHNIYPTHVIKGLH